MERHIKLQAISECLESDHPSPVISSMPLSCYRLLVYQ